MILAISTLVSAQVKTTQQNKRPISARGFFNREYAAKKSIITPPDPKIYKKKLLDDKASRYIKPLRIAEPVKVNLDIVNLASWVTTGDMSYGKYTITSAGAKSLSINFDKFFIPANAEMYIYNKDGEMVTGPITARENNSKNVWGTFVYKGDELTMEIKVKTIDKKSLKLHVRNVAYGITQIYGYGSSSSCNINVMCAGSTWEKERNTVALILSGDGDIVCTGALINDVCNDLKAYFLTANHCLQGADVSEWRFSFNYMSFQCSPTVDGYHWMTFFGSTLRASESHSDFALLEMDQVPDAMSGINYAGWTRDSTTNSSTVIIHHPAGDVMKITTDVSAPSKTVVDAVQLWQLGVDYGTTNGGSSGAPYFNQDHKIIGQHYGQLVQSEDDCYNLTKYGGRFNASWDGNGTSSSRLKDWLDPANSNTVSMPTLVPATDLAPSGPSSFCTGPQNYTLPTLPSGMSLDHWSITPSSGVASLSTSGNTATLSYVGDGSVTLTAVLNNACGVTSTVERVIGVGGPTLSFYIDPLWYTENHTFCTNSLGNNFQIISADTYNVTSFEWGISPSTVIDANGWLEEQGVYFGTGGYYQIYARAKNACGYGTASTATYNLYVDDNCSGGLAVMTRSGVPTEEKTSDLVIYPNPAGNHFTGRVPSALTLKRSVLKITDINGRVVKRSELLQRSQFDVNISGLARGTYIVTVTDGVRSYSKKLIKR